MANVRVLGRSASVGSGNGVLPRGPGGGNQRAEVRERDACTCGGETPRPGCPSAGAGLEMGMGIHSQRRR